MYQSHPALQVAPEAHIAASRAAPTDGSPCLVVVLDDAAEGPWLACQILELAQRNGLGILLLGVAPDARGAAGLRRQLVTVAAFIRQEQERLNLGEHQSDPEHAPEIKIVSGKHWLREIEARFHAGDALSCYSGDTIGVIGRPLNDALASRLNVPIHIFEGLQSPPSHPGQTLSHVATWMGSVAAIIAFLFLQVQIVTQVQGWAQSVVLCLTVGAEVACIWFLNSLLGTV